MLYPSRDGTLIIDELELLKPHSYTRYYDVVMLPIAATYQWAKITHLWHLWSYNFNFISFILIVSCSLYLQKTL